MAAVLRINIITNASGAQGGINQTTSGLDRIGKAAKVGGAAMAAGLGVAAAGLIGLGKEAFDAASAVQQSMGALDSVFGDAAGQSKKWAASAAEDVGLAKSQYANLAVVLGSQLTNMGRSQREAGKETNELIKLGADLAATFGGSVEEAVSAVSSTLKGETDPIERYGISIKQSDINARLAADGLDKLQGAALKQATATTALTLITEQAAASQGAFGREANTAAGQQARLGANIENLKAGIGAGLLPVATAAFGFLNEQAIPAARNLGARLRSDLGPAVTRIGAFFRDDLVPGAQAVWTWFDQKIAPSIRGTVTPIFRGVGSVLDRVGGALDDNSASLGKLAKFIGTVLGIASKLGPVIGRVLGTQFEIAGEVIGTVVDVIGKLIEGISWAIDKIEAIGRAWNNSPMGKIGGFIGGLFGAADLTGPAGALSGAAPAYGAPGALSTAAAGFLGSPGFGVSSGTLAPYIDARSWTTVQVTVTGALDPVSVARQIREILRADEVRLGKTTTFGPGRSLRGGFQP